MEKVKEEKQKAEKFAESWGAMIASSEEQPPSAPDNELTAEAFGQKFVTQERCQQPRGHALVWAKDRSVEGAQPQLWLENPTDKVIKIEAGAELFGFGCMKLEGGSPSVEGHRALKLACTKSTFNLLLSLWSPITSLSHGPKKVTQSWLLLGFGQLRKWEVTAAAASTCKVAFEKPGTSGFRCKTLMQIFKDLGINVSATLRPDFLLWNHRTVVAAARSASFSTLAPMCSMATAPEMPLTKDSAP